MERTATRKNGQRARNPHSRKALHRMRPGRAYRRAAANRHGPGMASRAAATDLHSLSDTLAAGTARTDGFGSRNPDGRAPIYRLRPRVAYRGAPTNCNGSAYAGRTAPTK